MLPARKQLTTAAEHYHMEQPAAGQPSCPAAEAVNDGVNQLIVQLPQARNATETFGLFADEVHSIFQGLTHIR